MGRIFHFRYYSTPIVVFLPQLGPSCEIRRTKLTFAQPMPEAAISGAATSRVAELHAAREGGARVLVVNGDRDPFGIPGAQDADRVVVVPGETHALRGHRAVIVAAVAEWLPTVL